MHAGHDKALYVRVNAYFHLLNIVCNTITTNSNSHRANSKHNLLSFQSFVVIIQSLQEVCDASVYFTITLLRKIESFHIKILIINRSITQSIYNRLSMK